MFTLLVFAEWATSLGNEKMNAEKTSQNTNSLCSTSNINTTIGVSVLVWILKLKHSLSLAFNIEVLEICPNGAFCNGCSCSEFCVRGNKLGRIVATPVLQERFGNMYEF